MDINKAIAQSELQIFGGIPKVTRYWNDSEDKNIDILKILLLLYPLPLWNFTSAIRDI